MYAAPQTRPMLAGALAAAARGWHVFPLLPGTKKPARPGHRERDCTGTDPRCRDGHTGWDARATTDETRIRRAWADDAPTYGLGIATGPSGLVVVDLDTAKPDTKIPEPWNRFGITTGVEVLDHIAGACGGTITPTFTVRTPSGGTHLYYTAPEGARFGNTAGTIGWLIDTRAHGGYVVGAGSVVQQRKYVALSQQPPALLPEWIANRLAPKPLADPSATLEVLQRGADQRSRYANTALRAEIRHVLDAREGSRNDTLVRAAFALGQLVGADVLTALVVEEALMAAGQAIGLPARECAATIRSGVHSGMAKPRGGAA